MPESFVAARSIRQAQFIAAVDADERMAKKNDNSDRRRVDHLPSAMDRYAGRVRDQVIQALASLGYPSLEAVDCEVAAGCIVLSGSLPSYHLKQMAQVAALRVAGGGHVDNRVVVTTL